MGLYRRVLSGQIAPGQHAKFLGAVEEALDYQAQRGIAAQYAVWDSVTGPTTAVEIVSEFDALEELEQFEELVAQDQLFAELRGKVMQTLIPGSATVNLYRRLV